MRYMMFVKMDPEAGPPPVALIEAVEAEIKQQYADGILLDADGLGPAVEIRLTAGEVTHIDGPFAEAKEVAGGFSLFEVRSPDEAIELGRRMIQLHEELWPGQDVAVEMRPLFGPPTPAE
ncbi:YciI family protein [Nocardioides sp. NBC_00163]|uniref:YciI family protein n=1 Tax=unclassified Nocardioides TaxID=2615069 RepID=UPI00324365D1